jgi:hypothetical protein
MSKDMTLMENTHLGEYANELTIGSHMRAPTVPFGETPLVRKRNYSEQFDRMIFNGKASTFPRTIRG